MTAILPVEFYSPDPRTLLLLAALDVAGYTTGDGADRCTGPAAAAGDGRDSGAGCGTDGRAADRSLLLWCHRRASDEARDCDDCRCCCDARRATPP